MLRIYPERADYTSERVNGLPIIVTNHRERSAFNLTPTQSEVLSPVIAYNYDNEEIHPYGFTVELDDNRMKAEYALSHQSAIYQLTFETDKQPYVLVNTRNGHIKVDGNAISGYQKLDEQTKVYLYIETQETPELAGVVNLKVRLTLQKLMQMVKMHVRHGVSPKAYPTYIYVMVYHSSVKNKPRETFAVK